MRTLAILAAALAAAGVYVQARGLSWRTDVDALARKLERRAQVGNRRAELRASAGVSLEQFRALIDAGAVVIDARPRTEFEKGHLSIPSFPPVLNVEPDQVDQHLERLFQLQGQPIVLYCTSETCDLAEELYIALEALGFTDMKIYFGGWEGLLAAGMPTESGPDEWAGYGEPGERVREQRDGDTAPQDANDAGPGESGG